MEPAKIDWKNIDSRFVKDDIYEHINAPKWIDFAAAEESVDDDAWFCKPDCQHPKTVEDFLRSSTPTSKVKHLRSASSSAEILPLGDRNRRDANLKRRGLISSLIPSTNDLKPETYEDCENVNPNLSTPPRNHQNKALKAAIKSSTEKKKPLKNSPADSLQEDRKPQLKSTLSARNLFAGREILNQITEFCNELKNLAMRGKERENSEKSNNKKTPMGAKKINPEEFSGEISGDLNEREKEKKPLLEAEKGNSEAVEKSDGREKQRRKKRIEANENIQISVDLKKVEDSLLQVRTCPPSPQCFSASRGPLRPTKATSTTPLKPSKSMPTERGILQEVEQNKRIGTTTCGENGSNRRISIGAEGGRSLDMFWFLKPCTFLSK